MFVTGRRPFRENGRSIKFDLSLVQYLFALSAFRQLLDFALEGFRLLLPLLFETRFATHVTLPMLRWWESDRVSLSPMNARTVR